MERNDANRNEGCAEDGTAFKGALAQVARAKAAIFTESSRALRSQEHLLRLALNEAEAAARQTPYPHLVFPVLATEKVETVIAWDRRQQSLRETSPVLVLAA